MMLEVQNCIAFLNLKKLLALPPYREQVQFVFGGTEFSVNCFRNATGDKVANVALSLVQEVEEGG